MFISFEGIEGSGKGTLIKGISNWLISENIDFIATRQPGGTELGKSLRAILLDSRQKIEPIAELYMYMADRAQHVKQVIIPAIAENKFVLCDRYTDSTTVYQGYGRGISIDFLQDLNESAVFGTWPDITILLDLEPEIGLKRACDRNEQEGKTVTEGRFEAESLSFHNKIRKGYLDFALTEPDRFVILDGILSPDNLVNLAINSIKNHHKFTNNNK